MDINRFSKSLYEDFLRCPWRLDAIRNRGYARAAQSPAGEVGRAVHRFINYLLSYGLDLSTVMDLCRKEAGEEALELLQAWVDMRIPTEHMICAEHPFDVSLRGTSIRIIPDMVTYEDIKAVEGRLTILDWKTGHQRIESELEVLLYVYVCLKALPYDPAVVVFKYVWLRLKVETEWVFTFADPGVISVARTAGGLHMAFRNMAALEDALYKPIAQVLAVDPEPSPGPHCSDYWGAPCQFLGKECPARETVAMISNPPTVTPNPLGVTKGDGEIFLKLYSDGLTLGPQKQTAKRAARALNALLHIDTACKKVREALQDYARIAGPIILPQGARYGWKTSQTKKYDAEGVLKLLITNDLTWEEIAKAINVSETSLKKLGKKHRKLLDDLRLLYSEEETTYKWGPLE